MASGLESVGTSQIPIDLIISKGHLVLTHGELKVTDADGILVYRVDSGSTDTEGSKNRRILFDAMKNPLFSVVRCNNDGGWQGYRGESMECNDLIFKVKRTLHSRLRTELDVFLVGKNCGGSVPDFRVKGSPFHRSCIIYRGDSIVAQTSAMYKLGKAIVGRRKFRVTIYPGIDHSFVVALLVIFFDRGN